MAASPSSGHVFVSDADNARIAEFTVWGEFVKAWGFGVLPGSPDTELQNCTVETGCEEGVEGSEPGQLNRPGGVAVDSTGAVYVFERLNNRVTKSSEDGDFLLMFGGEVNKTDNVNVCTAADVQAGDDCGAGVAGSAPGFFENGTVGNFIDIGPAGTIYVGDKGRIQEFNPDGTFKAQIPFAGAEAPPAEASAWGIAVDPVSADVYVSTNVTGGLYRVDPDTGVFKQVQAEPAPGSGEKFPKVPAGIAVDSGGNLYVVDHRETAGFEGPFEILKLSPSGECLICGVKFAQQDALFFNSRALMGLATNDACDIPGDDLHVTVAKGGEESYLQSYGPAPQDVANCPPPEVAPEITDQYATDAGTENAEVQARINPRFWNDATYYVQYGPQACLDSGWTAGCSTVPAPPGDLLTDEVLGTSVPTDNVLLEGLEPDTVYHYRFVAESSGGGPVFGVDGTEAEEGGSSSFRTFPESPGPRSDCANQAFRIGLSAPLVDCRAYEMVSPVDKNGGDILTQKSIAAYPAELNLSSLDGEQATFSSETAFANSVSAPYSNQYIAKRDPSAGWQTEAISPPREELFRPAGTAQLYELDLQYKLFSPDLNAAWLMHEADPPLDECAVEGFINWYKRDNATGSYEAVTTKLPPSKGPLEYFSEVQGLGVDGEGRTHTIYRANDKLPLDGPPAAANITGYQLYEHISDPGGGCGETRLVSVLPNGTANTTSSSVGTAAVGTGVASWIEARKNLVHNAVSADGALIYWTAAGEGPGVIYVRANGTQTIKVSTGSSARFWTAASDGSVAYYTEGETLKRFAFPGPGSTTIAGGVIGLVGASEDASRLYFVSKEDLGGDATAGQPNLYLFEGATTTYIGTLSATDAFENLPSAANPIPVGRLAALSEDGSRLVFASNQSLAGQDNIDAVTGLRDSAVYLYEADSGELRCISCSFTGARPTGKLVGPPSGTQVGFAAGIPPWKNQFHAPRVISEDGSTVYFESLERLVPRDTNGNQDVYQWRRAGDEAACEAAGAELYNPVAGGCISLISSGTGDGDASFVDATPDGSDVFFKTPASILPQDPGRVDLYDARVGGGFAPEPICTNPNGCPEPPGTPPPPPVTPPAPPGPPSQFDPAKCKALQQKAKQAAAKARRLRGKAAKASGQKAKALRKQAARQTKKANKQSARAQACFTGARGK